MTPPSAEIPIEQAVGPLNSVEAKHAPRGVYLAGDRALLTSAPKVAIVGTRSPTPLGRRRATRLARELVAHGVTVVSGLANGIDTEAHRGAIEAGGRTIAVLGTPLDQASPRANAALQDEIAREHLVVSQWAPGTTVRRSNFVVRNRLMALIANATVIVEAGASSGTISQGYEALRLGRPLFLLASLADRTDLEWVGKMRQYGATPLAETAALLDAIPAASEPGPAALAF